MPTHPASAVVIGGDRDVAAWADDLVDGGSAAVIGPLGCGKSFLLGALVAELRARGIEPLVVRGAASLSQVPHGALAEHDLHRLEEARPDDRVTVVVDDAQHLDEASFQTLVRHLADGTAGVFLALTIDPDEASSGSPRPVLRDLLDLVSDDLVHRHDLRTVDVQDAGALIDTFEGGEQIDEPTRTAMRLTARGSRDVLFHLAAEAVRADAAGGEPLDAFLQPSPAPAVRDALARQLAPLGAPARSALVLLERMRGVPYADAAHIVGADVLDDLIAREFVLADGARRRRLYGRRMLARQAERELGPAAVDALLSEAEHHILTAVAAGAAAHPAVCAFLVSRRRLGGHHRGGWEALDVPTATRIAVGAAHHANGGHRPELALAAAQLHGVDPDDVELTLERVAALHDMNEHGRAFAELGRLPLAGVTSDVADRYAGRWAELLRWAPEERGLPDTIERLAPGALDAARARVDLMRAERALLAVDPHAALALARNAVDGPGSRAVVARASAVAATASALLDRAEDSDALFARARRAIWDPGSGRAVGPGLQLWALCLEACARTVTGRPLDVLAPQLEDATRTAVAVQDATGLALVDVAWAFVSFGRGDTAATARELRAALRRAVRVDATPWRAALASALGLVLALGGHGEDARRALTEADEAGAPSVALFDLLRLVAEAEVAAVEGDDDGQIATSVRAAQHLVARRSPVVDRLLATRYADVLAEAGLAVPRLGDHALAARPDLLLTEREAEIARLVARGLSNRRIAEQLVVSVRTVESHVYQACRKLGVASRRELGRLLAYEWLPPSGARDGWAEPAGRADLS